MWKRLLPRELQYPMSPRIDSSHLALVLMFDVSLRWEICFILNPFHFCHSSFFLFL